MRHASLVNNISRNFTDGKLHCVFETSRIERLSMD